MSGGGGPTKHNTSHHTKIQQDTTRHNKTPKNHRTRPARVWGSKRRTNSGCALLCASDLKRGTETLVGGSRSRSRLALRPPRQMFRLWDAWLLRGSEEERPPAYLEPLSLSFISGYLAICLCLSADVIDCGLDHRINRSHYTNKDQARIGGNKPLTNRSDLLWSWQTVWTQSHC